MFGKTCVEGVGELFCSAGVVVVSTASGSVSVGAIVEVVGRSVSTSRDDVWVTNVGIVTGGRSVGVVAVEVLVNVALSEVVSLPGKTVGTVSVGVVDVVSVIGEVVDVVSDTEPLSLPVAVGGSEVVVVGGAGVEVVGSPLPPVPVSELLED